jgi:hypothetical protein
MPLVPGEIVRVASRQHGLITRRQALAAGMPITRVDALVRQGGWRSLHRGVYLTTVPEDGSPLPLATTAMAAVLRWGPRVTVSHESAAELLGLPVLSTPASWSRFAGPAPGPAHFPLTLTVEPDRRIIARGVRVHRTPLARTDLVQVAGIPVTSLIRTVLDLVRTAPTLTALAAADAAAHHNPAIPDAVAYTLEMLAGHRSVRRAQQLLELVEPATQSPLETLLRELIRLGGLPRPLAQYDVRGPGGGLLGRVDLAYPGSGLLIEGDGRRYHENWADAVHDRRRQNLLVNAGFRVLRFTWEDAWRRPDETIAAIRAGLGSHP